MAATDYLYRRAPRRANWGQPCNSRCRCPHTPSTSEGAGCRQENRERPGRCIHSESRRSVAGCKEEINAVSQWLAQRTREGIVPDEIGVFVRSTAELDRARAAVEDAKIPYKLLDDRVETASGRASIAPMH